MAGKRREGCRDRILWLEQRASLLTDEYEKPCRIVRQISGPFVQHMACYLRWMSVSTLSCHVCCHRFNAWDYIAPSPVCIASDTLCKHA